MTMMKTKGVAFNLDDPDQNEMFKYALSRPNFSSYIKRLIQRDMEKQIVPKPHEQKREPMPKPKPSIFEIAAERKALKAGDDGVFRVQL